MSKRKNNRRILNGDGEWTYRCSHCKEQKTSDNFHSDNSKPPFYLAYMCKDCRKTANNRPPILEEWENNFGKTILKRMGYDINLDIHKQFIDKVKDKYGVVIM